MRKLLFPPETSDRLQRRISGRFETLVKDMPADQTARFLRSVNFCLGTYETGPLADILDTLSWSSNQTPWEALTQTCRLANGDCFLPRLIATDEPPRPKPVTPADEDAPPPPLPHADPRAREVTVKIAEPAWVALSELRRSVAAGVDPSVTDGDMIELCIRATWGVLRACFEKNGKLTAREVCLVLAAMQRAEMGADPGEGV